MNSTSWYGDRERGWFWYEEPAKEEDQINPGKPEALTQPTEPTWTEKLEKLQAQIKEAKARAVLNPTEANLARYMELQKQITDRSSLFADTWQRVLWGRPDLDETVKNPVVAAGTWKKRDLESEESSQAVKRFGEYGLFFFYKADCPYCEVQSQLLRDFAAKHKVEVIAVSLDGTPPPAGSPFPWRRDNGISKRLGVQMAPALFAVNPDSRDVQVIGYGALAHNEMEKRMRRLLLRSPGEY